MKSMNKKGFTIVELVIVIAVIAILAAVLIPTFATVIEKANQSSAMQAAKNEYELYLANYADTGMEIKSYIIESGTYSFVVENGTFLSTAYKTADANNGFNGYKAKSSATDLTLVSTAVSANAALPTDYFEDTACKTAANGTAPEGGKTVYKQMPDGNREVKIYEAEKVTAKAN